MGVLCVVDFMLCVDGFFYDEFLCCVVGWVWFKFIGVCGVCVGCGFILWVWLL